MASLKKLASQAAVYGLSSIIGRVINWGLTPVYAHYFLPEEFGVFTQLYGYTVYALILLTFGMETSFFHFAGQKIEAALAYSQAFVLVALLSLGFGVVAGALYVPLAGAMGYADRPLLVLLIIPIIVFDGLAALPMARLRYLEKPSRFAIISLANIGFTLVLNIIFVMILKLGIEAIFVANILASALRLFMALAGNMPVQLRPQADIIRKMGRYGQLIMLTGMAGAINELLDRILIPYLWPDGGSWRGQAMSGLTMNGIYGAVFKLAVFITLAIQAYRYAAEPFFFKEASSGREDRTTFARAMHYFLVFCLLAFLYIGTFSYEIVSFNFFGHSSIHLLNPRYWGALDALPLLLWANLTYGVYINLSIWYKITGQLRVGLMIVGAGALVTVAGNFLLVPSLGYMASALMHVASYTVMSVLCYLAGQRYYPVPYRLNRGLLYGAFILLVFTVNHQFYYAWDYGAASFIVRLGTCLGASVLLVGAELVLPAFPRRSAAASAATAS